METAQQQEVNNNKDKQDIFGPDTKKRILEELQEINNGQQQRQQGNSSVFVKFHDGQRRRLSFTGQFEKKRVQDKDYTTGQLIPDKFSNRWQFSVYDITDPDHPSGLSVWERGIKEATTVLFWLSRNQKVLDVERHGRAGDKNTSYQIYPPMG